MESAAILSIARRMNIGRQIERMRRVASTADGSSATSLPDYMLGLASCFFKVCHPDFDLGSSELSKGMYMDLDLWELVTASRERWQRRDLVQQGSSLSQQH